MGYLPHRDYLFQELPLGLAAYQPQTIPKRTSSHPSHIRNAVEMAVGKQIILHLILRRSRSRRRIDGPALAGHHPQQATGNRSQLRQLVLLLVAQLFRIVAAIHRLGNGPTDQRCAPGQHGALLAYVLEVAVDRALGIAEAAARSPQNAVKVRWYWSYFQENRLTNSCNNKMYKPIHKQETRKMSPPPHAPTTQNQPIPNTMKTHPIPTKQELA